jgi:hypothetical protein
VGVAMTGNSIWPVGTALRQEQSADARWERRTDRAGQKPAFVPVHPAVKEFQ